MRSPLTAYWAVMDELAVHVADKATALIDGAAAHIEPYSGGGALAHPFSPCSISTILLFGRDGLP